MKRSPLKRKTPMARSSFEKHLKRTPVSPISQRRRDEKAIYLRERVVYLIENPWCVIKSPVCTKRATVINHKRGRDGPRYLNKAEWEASCFLCNDYCEKEKEWAWKHGHRLDRIGKLS